MAMAAGDTQRANVGQETLPPADEGGAYEVGINWRDALPAYFRCLAESSSAELFAQAVDRVILDFAEDDRAHFLAEACRLANKAQRAAVSALTIGRRR